MKNGVHDIFGILGALFVAIATTQWLSSAPQNVLTNSSLLSTSTSVLNKPLHIQAPDALFSVFLPTILANSACLSVPQLVYPPNGARLDTLIPILRWNSGDGDNVTYSVVNVNYQSGGGELYTLFVQQVLGAWEVRVPNLPPDTSFEWSVTLYCNGGSNFGLHSQVRGFTSGSGGTILPPPTLIEPEDRATVGVTAVLHWAPVPGAVEYVVQAGYGNHCGGCDVAALVTGTQVTFQVKPDQTYHWYVIVRDDYAWSDYSEYWAFHTTMTSNSLLTR